MKRWTVRKNGIAIGHTEAMTTNEAVEGAIRSFNIDLPRETLHLERDELSMQILIDTTNCRAIARHDSYQALAALAVIQFANVDTTIVRMGENKRFSVFDADQLKKIAESVGVKFDKGDAYGDKIKKLRAALESFDYLNLPFTTEQLEAQAFGIHFNDDKPYAFDPQGDAPKPMPKWHFEPQRNRKRIDSSFGHCFSAGIGYGSGVVPSHAIASESAPAKKPPSPPAARRADPGAPSAAPKPPKAPSGPVTRPKAGSATGRVWDIADEVRAANPKLSAKELKSLVVAQCEEQGINAGTAGVQFGKWKSQQEL